MCLSSVGKIHKIYTEGFHLPFPLLDELCVYTVNIQSIIREKNTEGFIVIVHPTAMALT